MKKAFTLFLAALFLTSGLAYANDGVKVKVQETGSGVKAGAKVHT